VLSICVHNAFKCYVTGTGTESSIRWLLFRKCKKVYHIAPIIMYKYKIAFE